MQNILRRDDYVNEYLSLVYDSYKLINNPYFVVYYTLDKRASTYDEHYGDIYKTVGEQSGLKWNKILNLPVYSVEYVTPTLDYNESGISAKDSLIGSGIMSPETGIVPKSGDMFITKIENDISMFVITGVTLSSNMPFDKPYTRFSFKPTHYTQESIERNVNGVYVYLEPIHKILPIEYAEVSLQLINRLSEINSILQKEFFDSNLDTFVVSKSPIVIDQDLVIAYNDFILPNITLDLSPVKKMDISIDDELTYDHIYRLLFSEFSENDYNTTTTTTTYGIFNKMRVNIYRDVKIFTYGDEEPLLDYYYEDPNIQTDIDTALYELLLYRLTGSCTPSNVPTTTVLGEYIKMYLESKTTANQLSYTLNAAVHFPQPENLLESIYALYLLNDMLLFSTSNIVIFD